LGKFFAFNFQRLVNPLFNSLHSCSCQQWVRSFQDLDLRNGSIQVSFTFKDDDTLGIYFSSCFGIDGLSPVYKFWRGYEGLFAYYVWMETAKIGSIISSH